MRILTTQLITLVLQAIKTTSEEIKPVTQHDKHNYLFSNKHFDTCEKQFELEIQKLRNGFFGDLYSFFLIAVCLFKATLHCL